MKRKLDLFSGNMSKEIYDWRFCEQEFLIYCELKNLSSFTLRNYEHSLEKFANWLALYEPAVLDDINLATENIVQQYIFLRKGEVSANSVNTDIRILKIFWTYLKKKKYATENVCEHIKQLRVDKQVKKVVTEAEFQAMLKACKLDRFEDITVYVSIMMLRYLGLRANELCNLTLADIDLDKEIVTVAKSKSRKYRTLPIHPKLLKVIKSYLKVRNNPPHKYFLTTNIDTKMTVRNLEFRVKAIADRCNFEGITPHAFRRFFISSLVEQNVDLLTIKELSGHSSLDMLQIYTKISDERLANEVKKLK